MISLCWTIVMTIYVYKKAGKTNAENIYKKKYKNEILMIILFLYQTINCLLISALFLLRGTCFKHRYTETPQNWAHGCTHIRKHDTWLRSLKHWFVLGKMEFFFQRRSLLTASAAGVFAAREKRSQLIQTVWACRDDFQDGDRSNKKRGSLAVLQGVGGTFLKREEIPQRWSSEALRASVGP